MPDDFEWSDWIAHDDSGLPRGLEPDEVVIAQLEDGYVLSPMPVANIDWHCPSDAVRQYKRRIWREPVPEKQRELETT